MDRNSLARDLDEFRRTLRDHGSDFLEDPTWDAAGSRHVSVRMVIDEVAEVARWSRDADAMADRIEIQSVGRSLEVVKDTGGAAEVADRHGVRHFVGTHGLGHARLATESSVSPTASHPFWARPFPGRCHRPQRADHGLLPLARPPGAARVPVHDRERQRADRGVDLGPHAPRHAPSRRRSDSRFHEIDGVFTYLIADERSIGFAKDRWAHQASGGDGDAAGDRGGHRGAGGAQESTGRKATSPTTTDPA